MTTTNNSTPEIDYEEIRRKNNYRNLINNINSIISSLDAANVSVRNMKNNINNGIKFDDKCYESDNINNISDSITNCRNSLSSINKGLRNNL